MQDDDNEETIRPTFGGAVLDGRMFSFSFNELAFCFVVSLQAKLHEFGHETKVLTFESPGFADDGLRACVKVGLYFLQNTCPLVTCGA